MTLKSEFSDVESTIVSGDFKFIGEMKSPMKFAVGLEKFERGKWHTAILNRNVDDLCASLQNPSEPWYDFFSNFKKKDCPFPAGHVETFENQKIKGIPEYIPYNFIGKYRATVKFFFPKQTDCAALMFEVMDV